MPFGHIAFILGWCIGSCCCFNITSSGLHYYEIETVFGCDRTCYQRHWPMIYSQALESMYSNNAKANNNSNYRQESFAPLWLIQKHFCVCYFLSFRCDALFHHRECHVSCLSIQLRIMRHFSRKLHTKQPTEKTIRSSDTECHTISTTLIPFVSVFHSKTHTKSKMPFSMAYEKRSYFEISLCFCLSLSLVRVTERCRESYKLSM